MGLRFIDFFCGNGFLYLFFSFFLFLFLRILLIFLLGAWRSHLSRSTPGSPTPLSLDSPFNFLTFLSTAFSGIRISEIKIAIKLISPWAAGLVIRLIHFISFLAKVAPKKATVAFPECITINFTLDQVLHFGAPLFSKLHTLDGSFNRRAWLRLLTWVIIPL